MGVTVGEGTEVLVGSKGVSDGDGVFVGLMVGDSVGEKFCFISGDDFVDGKLQLAKFRNMKQRIRINRIMDCPY